MRLEKTAYTIKSISGYKLITRLTAVLLAYGSLCWATSEGGPAISGRVSDAVGGAIPNARIFLHKLSGEPYEATATPDNKGEYAFDALPDGYYSLRVTAGFVGVSYEPLKIEFPRQLRRMFVLEVADTGSGDGVYSSSELVGILDLLGKPISGATICAVPVELGHRPACTVTNRLGQYFLSLQPGMYVINVIQEGGQSQEYRMDMGTAGEYRDRVHLTPSAK
jgi:Carboxypeptidase regulatory-like domain